MSIIMPRKGKKPVRFLLPVLFILALAFATLQPCATRADSGNPTSPPPVQASIQTATGTMIDRCGNAQVDENGKPTTLQNMTNANNAAVGYKTLFADKFFQQMPIRNMKQCIQRLLMVYDTISKILNGSLQSAVGKIILGIIGYVAQMVMQAVCNAIRTAINDLLGAVCIPVPNLQMITLPSLASTGCLIGSGTSVTNLIMGLGNLMATPTGNTISVPGMPPLNVPLGRNICRQVTGGSTVCEP
jgi:hypothetical protein